MLIGREVRFWFKDSDGEQHEDEGVVCSVGYPGTSRHTPNADLCGFSLLVVVEDGAFHVVDSSKATLLADPDSDV